jgi:hypothetical protein
MDEVREKKLRQVRALLDKASDPATTPAEAQALREKADDLMLAYAISEFEAQQRIDKGIRQKPEQRHIRVCEANNLLKPQLVTLMGDVVWHCRCKAVFSGLSFEKAGSTATVVGFPSDLDYLEMLFTSLMVQMAQHLEPAVNPALSEVENLVALKEAGLKWARIHQLLHPEDSEPVKKAQGVRYTKLYTEYCTQHNRKRMYTSPQAYQRNYAEGFVREVGERLYQIRLHQKQQGLSGGGMELALRDEVGEAFNDMFTNVKSVNISKRGKFDQAAFDSGRFDGSRADLGQGRMGNTKELT